MIKGILLGICISVFIVSLILVSTSTLGALNANIITGTAIGEGVLVSYSILSLVFSFIAGFIIILLMRK